MQAELCWEVSLPRLLLFLAVLPVSPALPKQLRAVLGSGCASLQHCSGSLWAVLTCWEAPGVRTGTTGTKELVVVPPQLRCSCRGRGERSAVRRRNCWHGQAAPAEPSPSPVAPWGELELWSSLIPLLGVWGPGVPHDKCPQSFASLASPLPGVSAQSRGDQRCSACLGCSIPPSFPPGSSFPSLWDPAGHLCPSHEHRPGSHSGQDLFWLQGSHGSGKQRSGNVCGCPGAKVTLTGSSPGAPQRWASPQRGWGGWQLREWVCRVVGTGRGLGTVWGRAGGAHAIS